MVQSKAKTVAEYLSELPEDRRVALQAVRSVILENLGDGFEEGMQYGMIGYYVPHRLYPAGYHCDPKQPLPFAGLASQKNHMSIYLMCLYTHEGGSNQEELDRFVQRWKKTGKKLDMGKACIRFKTLDALALDLIGDAIARVPVKEWVRRYELSREATSPSGKRAGAGVKPAAKIGAKKVAKKASTRAVAGKATGSKAGAAKKTKAPTGTVRRKR